MCVGYLGVGVVVLGMAGGRGLLVGVRSFGFGMV
jgi:hypothetical protein